MKILWVVARRVLPVTSGGRIRVAFTLRELQKRHELVVLSIYRGDARDPEYEDEFAREFPGSIAVYAGPHERQLALAVRVVAGLAPFGPIPVRQPASRAVRDALRRGRFDIAVFDFLDSALLRPRDLTIPAVLYEHNVESDLLASQSVLARSGRGRLSLAVRVHSLRNRERAALRAFDHTIAVSGADAARLRELAGHDRVTGVSTGVDLTRLKPAPLPSAEDPVVMFTGLMNWPPNVDAVSWFARAIWPRVLRDVPGAKFRIVGRDPSPAVRRLASDSIEVTGEVPEVADHLAEASVVVVPLRLGSGTRLKVYEAMAVGRPQVSTALGAEGLDVRDGHDLMFAETAEAFATQVVQLLTDRALAERIGQAAAETASRHGWDTAVQDVEKVLKSTIQSRASKVGRDTSG